MPSTEWINEKFLPSILSYWKSKTTVEKPAVFISEKQYNVLHPYLEKQGLNDGRYKWKHWYVLTHKFESKDGTPYFTVNFRLFLVDTIQYISTAYFEHLLDLKEDEPELYTEYRKRLYDFFMAQLNLSELDMVSDDENLRNTGKNINEICVTMLNNIVNIDLEP